jgi:hypothetical protein
MGTRINEPALNCAHEMWPLVFTCVESYTLHVQY